MNKPWNSGTPMLSVFSGILRIGIKTKGKTTPFETLPLILAEVKAALLVCVEMSSSFAQLFFYFFLYNWCSPQPLASHLPLSDELLYSVQNLPAWGSMPVISARWRREIVIWGQFVLFSLTLFQRNNIKQKQQKYL